jgi:preprotein translocase subunit SecD
MGVLEMELLATAALVLVIGMSMDACVDIFMGRRG